MLRDFTFIDDIIEGVFRVLTEPVKQKYKIYNIGNNKSEDLIKFIDLIESEFGEKAEKLMYPMQAGDVRNWADCQNLIDDYNYSPSTTIETGVRNSLIGIKIITNYNKMKNILITGGAGFIGSHLVRYFVNKYNNYKIYNLDNLTYAGNLENLAIFKQKKTIIL